MVRYQTIVSLLCTLILSSVFCASAFSAKVEQEVAERLRADFPQIPVAGVAKTPIEGLFEIIDHQNTIYYFFPESGHLLTGELWSKEKVNLTRQRFVQIMSSKYSQIPLDLGLKIGNGPNIVVEVTDPDCPYCRDGAAWFAKRNDVTRYIFFTPLTKLHPEAEQKARYILSAENPTEAYQDVMDGLLDGKPLPPFEDNGLLDKHQALGQKLGTRGTPNYWINGQFVSGSNHEEFLKYFKKTN